MTVTRGRHLVATRPPLSSISVSSLSAVPLTTPSWLQSRHRPRWLKGSLVVPVRAPGPEPSGVGRCGCCARPRVLRRGCGQVRRSKLAVHAHGSHHDGTPRRRRARDLVRNMLRSVHRPVGSAHGLLRTMCLPSSTDRPHGQQDYSVSTSDLPVLIGDRPELGAPLDEPGSLDGDGGEG